MKLTTPDRLGPGHSASGFDCGVPSLDDWLRHEAYANQLIGGSRTFVTCEAGRIAGYYTLGAGVLGVAGGQPGRRVPQPIPVAVLGRVAVVRCRQRRGFGRALVRDAVVRLLQSAHAFPVRGVLVDAISDDSRAFFTALGFEASPIDSTTLMASFADLRQAAH